jgi:hypothetical protein
MSFFPMAMWAGANSAHPYQVLLSLLNIGKNGKTLCSRPLYLEMAIL